MDFSDTLNIAKRLLATKHDLIKKATGWMLREVGKKDYQTLLKFLNDNLIDLSSVTFSYAIERLELKDKIELKAKRKMLKSINV